MNLHEYLAPYIFNTIRYFIFSGIPFLIFYIAFPQYFSKAKIQAKWAKHKDFIAEIRQSVFSSLIIATIIVLIFKTPLRQYTQVYLEFEAYPLWWIPLSTILALLIQDTYFYWLHRTIHHPKLYRLIHLEHHKSVNPSPWTSYRFSFIEAVLESLILPIIILTLPLHKFALLGFAMAGLFINVYGHLGFEIAPRWFRQSIFFEFINTSVHHNMHHEKFVGNYGLYFRIWDRLMGTEHPDYVRTYDAIQAKRFHKKSCLQEQTAS